MINKSKDIYIKLGIIYQIQSGEKLAKIILLTAPRYKKIRYGLKGNSKQYTFQKFIDIFPIIIKKRKLFLFIVNKDTEEKSEFTLEIPDNWPFDLAEYKTIQAVEVFDISKSLEEIGISK